uniref:Uncharacterized protein n=1 Tax=Romanomermis culicivorax TaxID=13658 RepID=A0A915KP06_ROMCU
MNVVKNKLSNRMSVEMLDEILTISVGVGNTCIKDESWNPTPKTPMTPKIQRSQNPNPNLKQDLNPQFKNSNL